MQKVEQDVELLNKVIENARMGLSAVEMLLEKSADEGMRTELMRQRACFEDIERKAERQLNEMGEYPDKTPAMQKAGLWMGLMANTALDKSPSHLAEMLLQGASMGIADLTKEKNRHADAPAETVGLANELIQCEQDSIERLKNFLR